MGYMSIAHIRLRYNNIGDGEMYERIRDLRHDKDLRQVDMAKILSCSQRVYSHCERGDLDIPTEILINLADFHATTTDYILGRTDRRESLPKALRMKQASK